MQQRTSLHFLLAGMKEEMNLHSINITFYTFKFEVTGITGHEGIVIGKIKI